MKMRICVLVLLAAFAVGCSNPTDSTAEGALTQNGFSDPKLTHLDASASIQSCGLLNIPVVRWNFTAKAPSGAEVRGTVCCRSEMVSSCAVIW
jgi:hypothetical protein